MLILFDHVEMNNKLTMKRAFEMVNASTQTNGSTQTEKPTKVLRSTTKVSRNLQPKALTDKQQLHFDDWFSEQYILAGGSRIKCSIVWKSYKTSAANLSRKERTTKQTIQAKIMAKIGCDGRNLYRKTVQGTWYYFGLGCRPKDTNVEPLQMISLSAPYN